MNRENAITTILIIEPSAPFRTTLERCLGALGFSVTTAADSRRIKAALAATRYDVVLVDWEHPQYNEFKLPWAVLQQQPGALIVTMGSKAGRCVDLVKPFDMDTLLRTLTAFSQNRFAFR